MCATQTNQSLIIYASILHHTPGHTQLHPKDGKIGSLWRLLTRKIKLIKERHLPSIHSSLEVLWWPQSASPRQNLLSNSMQTPFWHPPALISFLAHWDRAVLGGQRQLSPTFGLYISAISNNVYFYQNVHLIIVLSNI